MNTGRCGRSTALDAARLPGAGARRLLAGARWPRAAALVAAVGMLFGLAPGLAGTARAQGQFNADIQSFRPAMDARSFITVERSKVLGTFEPTIGLFLNYAFNPFTQEIGGQERAIVDSYGAANFVLALGFFNVVEVGLNLPVVLVRGDFDGPGDGQTVSGDGLGNLQLAMKIRVLDRERFPLGIALVPIVQFDTGVEDAFVSHGQSPIFRPKLVLDFDLGSRVGLAVNLGATLRETRSIDAPVTVTDADTNAVTTLARDNALVFGNQLDYAVGAGIDLIPSRLQVVLEVFGAVGLADGAERANPLEALGALRLFLLGNSFLTVGAATGPLDNLGDPDVRPFAGIVFEPTRRDRDGDGIPDDIDNCPDEPEDKDGFEDADGCPDPDNDNDGIPDLYDQCPDEPEDRNGFEDDDGCPDARRDRDRDGIIDSEDRCPDQPEDKDGFMDDDGCPDPDNDQDGILDRDDKCPNEPEDHDGFEDGDGCPDPDNDNDGIPDSRDRCPNEAENFNGVEDEDGCPEERRVVISGGKLRILDKVYFETNRDVIKRESYDILNQVADTLRENPQIKLIEVQGHTDSRGNDAYNLDLSNRRAAAVRRYLIENGRIAGDRLVSKGYGETMPIEEGESDAALANNRRVEFVILEEDGN